MTLGSISLITVPVTDQERAKAFYVDVLGFTVKMDYVMGAEIAGTAGAGARWLALTPPGGAPDIVVVTWFHDTSPPGSAKLSLNCTDVDAIQETLTTRGAKPTEVADAPWGRWFSIDDPDGNNWLIVQQGRSATTSPAE
jgi:catechol 2,3-dioxygenase-like lactoylglutathione lyase family enzyme